MTVSIEQAAANLAAALKSGNVQDAESALASYAEATADEDVPEADNGPLKSSLEDRFVAPPAEADILAAVDIVANEEDEEDEEDEDA